MGDLTSLTLRGEVCRARDEGFRGVGRRRGAGPKSASRLVDRLSYLQLVMSPVRKMRGWRTRGSTACALMSAVIVQGV